VALFRSYLDRIRTVPQAATSSRSGGGGQIHSVALDQAVRIAVKVLGGEFIEFGILQCQHLMNQTGEHIHAVAGPHLKLLYHGSSGMLLDFHLQPARA
jgi:hypothetical protein